MYMARLPSGVMTPAPWPGTGTNIISAQKATRSAPASAACQRTGNSTRAIAAMRYPAAMDWSVLL